MMASRSEPEKEMAAHSHDAKASPGFRWSVPMPMWYVCLGFVEFEEVG
jgi:hypothetical protein